LPEPKQGFYILFSLYLKYKRLFKLFIVYRLKRKNNLQKDIYDLLKIDVVIS